MHEREIFLKAIEKSSAAERKSFLDENCTDPKMREKIEQLLSASDQAGSFLEHPPLEMAPTIASAHPDGSPIHPPRVGTRVRYFGDYELVEEIARGGMGVVYKARQIRLNRTVALKMILAGQFASEGDVKRFYTEAEAAANLSHPGIVPIFEVGDHEGQHYFSMRFIEGVSLAERLSEGPLEPIEAAEVNLKIAEAIAYAHGQGVIHRDLKPANVLLQRCSNASAEARQPATRDDGVSNHAAQPCITDFGLAKRTEDDSGLTHTGQILGTPSFMPPEQATGAIDTVRPSADIYSLGAILYCTLTGRPPFQAANLMDTLVQVLNNDPPLPRELNPEVPRDLETICMKCLQKEPKRRYETAQALASDLARFLRGEPIHARPVGRMERSAKWLRRHPVVGALTAAIGVLLVAGTAISSFFAIQSHGRALAEAEQRRIAQTNERIATEARENETAARKLAEQHEQEAVTAWNAEAKQREIALERLEEVRRGAFNIQLGRIEHLWRQHPLRALELLDDTDFCPENLRDFTWKLLRHACGRIPRQLAHPADAHIQGYGRAAPAALSSRGDQLAWAAGQTVIVWDLPNDRKLATFEGDEVHVQALTFTPDGSGIVTAGMDASIELWQRPFNSEPMKMAGHDTGRFNNTARVNDLAVSADGSTLASAGEDGTIRLWEIPSGKSKAVLKGHAKGVRSVSFHPATHRLASSDGTTVRVWDVQAETVHTEFDARGSGQVAFSPNGRILATCTGRDTHLRDSESGEILGRLPTYTEALAFSADGNEVATANSHGDGKGPVTVWDTSTATVLGSFTGYQGGSIALSADGDEVVYGGERSVFIGDVAPELASRSWSAHDGQINGLVWSPDNRHLISSSGDQTIKVWHASTGQLLKTITEEHWVWSVAVSPDGARLAAATWTPADQPGPVSVWDLETGTRAFTLQPLDGHQNNMIQSVTYSPDGTLIATGGVDNKVRLWKADSGEHLHTLEDHAFWVSSVAFSPDSKTLASAVAVPTEDRGEIRFWDRSSRSLRHVSKANAGAVTSITFLPDGKTLASVDNNKTIHLWDSATGERRTSADWGTIGVASIACSPDGETLVTGGQKISLWDAHTGQARCTLTAEDGFSNAVFSHDGSQLAAAGPNRSIYIWEVK